MNTTASGAEPTTFDRFKAILASCHFMILATVDDKSRPWLAPLYFAYDDRYALYFISRNDSDHADHIRREATVAVAVFDSSCMPGSCDGIQLRGRAAELTSLLDIAHAANVLFTRRFQDADHRQKYFEPSQYKGATKMRLYRVIPDEAFVVDRSRSKDYRVAVDLPSRK